MTFSLRKPILFVPFHNRHRMYRFWDLSEKVKILLSFFYGKFWSKLTKSKNLEKTCFWSNEPSSMNWCCWIILVKDQLPKHNNIWSVWVIFLEILLRIHPFIVFSAFFGHFSQYIGICIENCKMCKISTCKAKFCIEKSFFEFLIKFWWKNMYCIYI